MTRTPKAVDLPAKETPPVVASRRRYYGCCNNPRCPRNGEPVQLGERPMTAPVCDGCGEELQVFVYEEKAA